MGSGQISRLPFSFARRHHVVLESGTLHGTPPILYYLKPVEVPILAEVQRVARTTLTLVCLEKDAFERS